MLCQTVERFHMFFFFLVMMHYLKFYQRHCITSTNSRTRTLPTSSDPHPLSYSFSHLKNSHFLSSTSIAQFCLFWNYFYELTCLYTPFASDSLRRKFSWWDLAMISACSIPLITLRMCLYLIILLCIVLGDFALWDSYEYSMNNLLHACQLGELCSVRVSVWRNGWATGHAYV